MTITAGQIEEFAAHAARALGRSVTDAEAAAALAEAARAAGKLADDHPDVLNAWLSGFLTGYRPERYRPDAPATLTTREERRP